MIFPSSVSKVVFVFFATFFVINIFCWVKLFFEISKFKKLEKLDKELLMFTSPFFLNRLVEIKNLSIQNKKYISVFLCFYEKYQNLFHKKGTLILSIFFKDLKKKEDWNNFLIESELRTTFFKDFAKFKKDVENFSNDLRLFSVWENSCLDKINSFNLILDSVSEDLERAKINLAFNFQEVDRILHSLSNEIINFKKIIYYQDHKNTFSVLKTIEEKISLFSFEIFVWLKILNLNLIVLPKKNKELIHLLSELNFKNERVIIDNLNNNYYQKRYKIELFLADFEVKDAELFTNELIFQLENQIFQLKHNSIMKKFFQDTFQFVISQFEKIKKDFLNFEQLFQNFNKDFFYQQFQVVGFQNFNNLISKIQKEVDDLFIDDYGVDDVYFFKSLISKVKVVLIHLLDLTEVYFQMDNFFALEKEKNETIFLSLLNLSTLLNKKKHFALKIIYHKELSQKIEFFLNLEKKRFYFDDFQKTKNYNFLFNSLQSQVISFKNNVQNTVFCKSIAELLFVKANKKRFENEFYHNKILNCEVLFLKQQYKNVIELLLEILDPETYF